MKLEKYPRYVFNKNRRNAFSGFVYAAAESLSQMGIRRKNMARVIQMVKLSKERYDEKEPFYYKQWEIILQYKRNGSAKYHVV